MRRMLSPITNGGIQSRREVLRRDEDVSSNEVTDDPSTLRTDWTRHARLEPRQMVISADFVASNQRFDR